MHPAPARPWHFFLVEDDPTVCELLAGYLQRQGVLVTCLPSAEALHQRLRRERPDLLVLDIQLPGQNGLQACQRLRAEGDRLPVLLLSARADEVDRVLGLELGADDYLTKPFSARELLARAQAVLRRTGTGPRPATGDDCVRLGALEFHRASRSLRQGDALHPLNTVEHALLAELTAHPGLPVSRARLVAVSHDRDETVLPRAVDAAIMRLRKRVEPQPARPRYIQTVRGQGYMFVPEALA